MVSTATPSAYRSAWALRGSDRPAPPVPARFRPDVEGLRAVAILLVVLYHAGVGAIGGGYVGVDVFFVISGYLITGQLARELSNTGRIGFGRFYARRIVRLLPASVLVSLATLLATWHWASPLFARVVSMDTLSGVTYVINVRLAVQATNYLDATRAPSPLQHLWSLAVEEQFYLFWPAVLTVAALVWLRPGRRRPSLPAAAVTLSLLCGASFALCVWQTTHQAAWAYFGLPARAWELAAGGLVALGTGWLSTLGRRLGALLSWVGLAAVAASAVLYTDATAFPGYAAALPVAGAALVVAGGCTDPRLGAGRVLGLAPMRELGRLSYSWYLWHWPVLALAPYALGHDPSTGLNLLLVTASLVPAAMSLTAVEDRVRFHPMFRRQARAGLLFGLSLTLVAAGLATASLWLPTSVGGRGTAPDTSQLLAVGQSNPPHELLDLINRSTFTTAMPGNLQPRLFRAVDDRPADAGCLAELAQTSVEPATQAGCESHGDPHGASTIVLFGDSHADQWFDAVNAIAVARHWRLAVFTKGGCSPASALTWRAGSRQPYTECTQWRASAMARILALRPRLVILATRTYYGNPLDITGPTDQAWASAWLTTLDRLRPLRARTVVIGDTPDPHRVSIPDCVSAHPLSVRTCALKVATAIDAGRRTAVSRALAGAGVGFIDPTPWFCATTLCPAIIGNTLVYRDDSHISATYAKLLSPLLEPLLGDVP